MFDLSNISRFEGEKGTCKILKPVWDVSTDYLVVFLAVLSIAFGGMQVTSGTFECLAAVHCPGMSTSNMSSSLFSNIKSRNTCDAFYSSQKTNVINGTDVVADLKSNVQYTNFVNSECSKSAVPDFLSYFGFVLFIQAFVLIVLDNLWLKLPNTASVIESFVSLVVECYASTFESDNNLSYRVRTFQKNVELRCCKIWKLYLLKATLQFGFAAASLGYDIYHMTDLQETMTCTLTQHIPVAHDYFICSHNLAPAFVLGLEWLYLPPLGITIAIYFFIIFWTVRKGKNKFQYVFDEKKLPSLEETTGILFDVLPVDQDLGFLLHLLDWYDKSYVVRFAHFLPRRKWRVPEEHENEQLPFIANGIPQTSL